jgi:ArsR family transcriptional regulator, arsenate/arsenite/antimonite-responsive transcriptional repressor
MRSLATRPCQLAYHGVYLSLIPRPQRFLDNALYFHIIGNMKNKDAIKALAALAQESRLNIFRLLVKQGPDGLAAGIISEKLRLPNATLSFHLKELSHAELLDSRQEGRFVIYSANFKTMNALLAYLTENCCAGSAEACDAACAPVCEPAAVESLPIAAKRRAR